MKNYARIEDQHVAEIVSLSVQPSEIYHPSLEWIDITSLAEAPEVGYFYNDGHFAVPAVEPENAVLVAKATQTILMEEASNAIAPLQDAVDINIATDEEVTRLAEWKKYRVLLSRINMQDAPDIEWPTKPA
ncbi:tail fiber assembly protein [Pantoea latae]|uniref:Phage tail protein n=1 Tax=Pantoea latae TaxID=1964541 RepID=A0A1V9DAU1_9GAMM|nr:tail fiber assembly protein [Pantoea latae]OQP31001.1 phage tail protein [Pantoea latae]